MQAPKENHFAENLIKGRIAETVFELMFREKTEFDVYPLGYEHTIPILRQFRDHKTTRESKMIREVSENLSHTPDFLLCLPDKTDVYLVEVKYRREMKVTEILRIAKKIHERWRPVKLFLATLAGFYFDTCQQILETQSIQRLPEYLIPKETQEYYLNLLRRFEQ
jgi:hypothetical protein